MYLCATAAAVGSLALLSGVLYALLAGLKDHAAGEQKTWPKA